MKMCITNIHIFDNFTNLLIHEHLENVIKNE